MPVTQEDIDSVVNTCAEAGHDAATCGRGVISRVCDITERRARDIQTAIRLKAGVSSPGPQQDGEPKESREDEFLKDEWRITMQSARIKNYDQLVAACDIDLTVWEPERFKVKSYEVTYVPRSTRASGGQKWIRPDTQAVTIPMWGITASFKRMAQVSRAKDVLEAVKKDFSKLFASAVVPARVIRPAGGYFLEINISDHHFGKLAWADETRESSQDLRISTQTWREAVEFTLAHTAHYTYDEIIFVVGNDIAQVDNAESATAHGTRVDSDGRYAKIYTRILSELMWAIRRCQQVCPVIRLIVVPGNHDPVSSFTIGEALRLALAHDPNISIDNAPSHKKIYQRGRVLLGWEHGHCKSRFARLPLNLAVDFPEEWARSDFREIHTGHVHHLTVEDVQSVIVRQVAALTTNDAWHAREGYVAQRSTEAFIWHDELGLVGTSLFTLPRRAADAARRKAKH